MRLFFLPTRGVLQIALLLALNSCATPGSVREVDSGNFEIRWFFQGTIPEEIVRWFERDSKLGPNITAEEERSDFYLVANEAEILSPKLREGKLEIKYRSSAMDLTACDGQISGVAENWSKEQWSYSRHQDQEVRRAFSEQGLKGRRAEVSKVRRQRKFEVFRDGSVRPVSLSDRLETAALIELTEVTVEGIPWWTIAFEILTDENLPALTSRRSLCDVFANYPSQNLVRANSYSYPKWLSEMAKK